MKSRKAIVPINIENPDKKINDFLYPKLTNDGASFFRVSNEKEWKYGMVVLKGGGVTENDLFAKIVDAKTKIESVDKLLETLKVYLEKVKEFSIGNIVYVESSNNNEGFVLKKHANRPNIKRNNKLP
ncbi:hypothetical protein [Aquimarina sediminis]|uniref:hypothetical protein n=1 Tax=Aquimarina sediminis TaxID=2070536 RepID=UPI000CA0870A|nr:hypothetical protein [Aquimarina sediminis]